MEDTEINKKARPLYFDKIIMIVILLYQKPNSVKEVGTNKFMQE